MKSPVSFRQTGDENCNSVESEINSHPVSRGWSVFCLCVFFAPRDGFPHGLFHWGRLQAKSLLGFGGVDDIGIDPFKHHFSCFADFFVEQAQEAHHQWAANPGFDRVPQFSLDQFGEFSLGDGFIAWGEPDLPQGFISCA